MSKNSLQKLYLYCCFIIHIVLTFPHASSQRTLQDCNPPVDQDRDQYIIGYGSLMESSSKNRTYQSTGENLPILVAGYSRQFNCKGVSSSLSTTYLGVLPNRTGTFNGVIFKVPNRMALDAYDERELYYCRELVSENMISLLVSSEQNQIDLPKGQFWIYVTKPQYTANPSTDYPIVQSYVDVFLSGCLEMQEKHNLNNFAEDCVSTTGGWEYAWINDRIYPRRPFIHQPKAGQIDKLLAKIVPNHFKNIQIQY